MAMQYDPATGEFVDDGVGETPTLSQAMDAGGPHFGQVVKLAYPQPGEKSVYESLKEKWAADRQAPPPTPRFGIGQRVLMKQYKRLGVVVAIHEVSGAPFVKYDGDGRDDKPVLLHPGALEGLCDEAEAAPVDPPARVEGAGSRSVAEMDAVARTIPGFQPDISSPCLRCGLKHAGDCAPPADAVWDLVDGELVDVTPGRVIEPPATPPPAVMPEFAQKFLDEPTRKAGVPAEPKPVVVPEKMVLFWRRAFEFYVDNCYLGRTDGRTKAKVWLERYKHCVVAFRRDRDQVTAERDAFLNLFPPICWETSFLLDKTDPEGRGFKLVDYGWWEWPAGKPRIAPTFWMPPIPQDVKSEKMVHSEQPGGDVRPAGGEEVQASFWQQMKAGLGSDPRRR